MKIIQIIPHQTGLFALSEDGDVYTGNFIGNGDELIKPEFMWRRLPTIVKGVTFTFKIRAEKSEAELQELRNQRNEIDKILNGKQGKT